MFRNIYLIVAGLLNTVISDEDTDEMFDVLVEDFPISAAEYLS